jgi:putative endonuclease
MFKRVLNKMSPKPRHLLTGEWGEAVAADMLKAKGFRVLGRRVRVGTRDELDLIARDGDVLVFVEVKTRKSERFGRPMSSVKKQKRHTLSRAAVRYIKKLRNPNICFRFDVVEVIGDMDSGVAPITRHIENAFSLDKRYMLPLG